MGGAAILNVGATSVGNFFKNTQLAVADGNGSSVIWNSVNSFYFQPAATMQGGGVTQKVIDSMQYAGTITDWSGKTHQINTLNDLKQYNQYLIQSIENKTYLIISMMLNLIKRLLLPGTIITLI